MLSQLPPHILAAIQSYRTCEFSSLGRGSAPVSTPVSPLILPDTDRLLVTTSIGLANKAFNVRRDGRVALLFSNPTASGLAEPPAVLIQGDAVCPEQVETWSPDLAAFWAMIAARQPASALFSASPLARWFFDWYYMRLLIWVTPRRVRWWERGDMAAAPCELEVSYVG